MQCVAAYNVLSSYGIKLIACATSGYYSSLNGGSGNWFNDMAAGLTAASGSKSMIGGWTLHPYCPSFGTNLTTVGSDGYGWPLVTSLRAFGVRSGWPDLPWYITEFGYSNGISDSSGLSTLVTNVMHAIAVMPWVAYLGWYSAGSSTSDPSPAGFGITTASPTISPGLTTAALNTMAAMIAANPSRFGG